MIEEPERLVRAAQGGDTLAMNDLLDQLTPYVGRICGPIALSNGPDATQEALVAVFRSLRSLKDPAALFGWVRVRMLVRSAYGMRAQLEGVARPGWCWLQSRFLLIGMAAADEPTGGTRVALTGGVRVPGRARLVPIGVRRESRKSLDRLAAR